MSRSTFASTWPTAGLAALVLCFLGCDGDVVAKAGRTRITRGELEVYLSRRNAAIDAEAAMAELGPRALLAEAARKDGLEDDLAVKARLAASRREILAQAYLDRELAGADREDALRARYAAQKNALTKRRVHVAHIVFLLRDGQPHARERARSEATRAYARLTGGEPFEQTAKELSEDPVTAARGGDLGPLLEGEVDSTLFEAAAALRAGELSAPVETRYGFHVLKALAPLEQVAPSFEDVRGALAAAARRDAEEKLLERLRKDIGLDVRTERVREVARPKAQRGGEGR
jgi:parvulin-like peptidyl-prolyl isomerase